jgi:hypothetical protein
MLFKCFPLCDGHFAAHNNNDVPSLIFAADWILSNQSTTNSCINNDKASAN